MQTTTVLLARERRRVNDNNKALFWYWMNERKKRATGKLFMHISFDTQFNSTAFCYFFFHHSLTHLFNSDDVENYNDDDDASEFELEFGRKEISFGMLTWIHFSFVAHPKLNEHECLIMRCDSIDIFKIISLHLHMFMLLLSSHNHDLNEISWIQLNFQIFGMFLLFFTALLSFLHKF